MNELDDIKKIIDSNLDHIKVTNRLKKQTLKGVFNKENNFLVFLKRNWMKTTTVFSVFVVVFTLSIQALFNQNKPDKITPTTTYQSITQCPLKSSPESSDSAIQDEKTSDDDCQINP